MRDADKIAQTLPLTTELLIEKVFEGCKKTFKTKRKQRQLIRFIDETINNPRSFSNDKPFVIYCMLRLWYEGRVENFNFRAAWEDTMLVSFYSYKRWYDTFILDKQNQTIVV